MKKLSPLFLLATMLFFANVAAAQIPQLINYQAVARDGNGAILNNHTISVRFIIHDSSHVGPVLYKETHLNVGTNQFGLFTT